MIIDCHGHYTTAPPQLGEYREQQVAALVDDPAHVGTKGSIDISDDELVDSLESNQLRLQRERGIDLTLFSPRASWMGHHVGNAHTSRFWTEHCNDIIRRVCDLYPDNFAPVCQLPQSPGVGVDASVRELRRCVEELGFVGCNLNPDPSGGFWNGPPLFDPAWHPLYETMCELDVPAMIHVSAACNPHFHSTGSHYLGADTTAFMQALTSGLFRDFPEMRWVIPHGGGAVPYHWGRFKGMAEENSADGWPLLDELMRNVFFDTCVYHQPGIDLLVDVVPTRNVLFASEMVGAVKGTDPDTGEYYDDTKRYVDRADLTDDQRLDIFERNVQRVYPRLKISASDRGALDFMNRNVIVRTIERAAPDVIDGLGDVGTATVHEAIGRVGFIGPHIAPIQRDTRIAGSAVTVLSHPGDNLMIHAAVEVCRPGDVLVVVNTAPSTHGMFGDLLAASLMAHGVRGLVIDAGVRDTMDLRAMGFPVWTQHVSCQGTVKNTAGSVNVPVVLGGVTVHPGDVVCADDDGVVVVARDEAAWALEQSTARIAKEAATRQRLEAGELGLDFYGLRAKLVELGVEYVD